MIEIVVRIAFSLFVVLMLLWLLARVARKPLSGRLGGALSVLARQQLSRGASVAVVRVGERALVLGVTDQQVTLLMETEPGAVQADPKPAGEVREALSLDELDGPVTAPANGRLSGSALSPDTWRQAVTALRKGRGA
jgi:flagellar protein FliO/FliZ